VENHECAIRLSGARPRSGIKALVLFTLLAGGLPGCAPGSPHEPPPVAAASSSALPPSLPADVAQGVVGEATQSPSVPPLASPPQWISYPAAGIELAVLPLTPSADELAAGALVPPMTMDAYWLTNYGQPGSDSNNTTYIVGHSWDKADAPFNRLSNQSAVGDELSVGTATGTIKYRVQSVTTHSKNTLRTSDVWNKAPGRLILISCYTDDIWGKNVVVTAVPSQ
jgi:LPXTG-site transpeptidase (sortase) family protein